MTKTEAKPRIEKLKKVIEHHRFQYHVLDKQTISDAALDSLKHELYKLEQTFPDLITPDSPTQRVGGKPLAKFEKVTHTHRMLSMEDVFSEKEFSAWHERIQKFVPGEKIDFFCMPKIDGLAVTLRYQDELLEVGATRGNGLVGENVTQNVKTIASVPLKLNRLSDRPLPKRIEVRGEIYIPTKAFDALNRQLKKDGKSTFANPRNTAAGSIRQLDSKIAAGRELYFVAWDLIGDVGQKTMAEEWEIMKKLGFRVAPESNDCRDVSSVKKHWNQLLKKRKKLDFWIDGMVVRVNNNALCERLGIVGKTPRGLIAWKFPAEESTTVVKEIEWFVGRTGALTPVALVEPTWIGGTTVQHASLHNFDEIERLDVRVNDTVILYKAGDIIPKIKTVLKDLRPAHAKPTKLPKHCPVCGSEVKRLDGEVAIVCLNPKCFVQNQEAILHAVHAFEIDGLGPQHIGLLLEQKLIHTQADLFLLKPDDLLPLERFAEISANKLVDHIQSRKNISLAKFILALGIRNVGEQTAIDLADHFETLDAIQTASLDELIDIEGVGEVVAKSISDFFTLAENQKLIEQYQKNGVVIQMEKKKKKESPFADKSFVMTGTLKSMSRDKTKVRIRALGGKPVESVSKKTDFVVVGDEPGSKAEKAKALGVKILSERQFLDMISSLSDDNHD